MGTSFAVEVDSGSTRRVSVEEGSVVVRLQQRPEVALRAGEAWEAPETNADTVTDNRTVRATVAAPPTAAAHPALRGVPRPALAASSASSTGESATIASDAASREEDSLYLRAVWLLRMGRADEARSAAREYLRRFPSGFRRVEMADIAQ
jgi:TolA-binding protein